MPDEVEVCWFSTDVEVLPVSDEVEGLSSFDVLLSPPGCVVEVLGELVAWASSGLISMDVTAGVTHTIPRPANVPFVVPRGG